MTMEMVSIPRSPKDDRNRDARLLAIYTTRQLAEQVLLLNDELEDADVLEVIGILRYVGADQPQASTRRHRERLGVVSSGHRVDVPMPAA
jgi:hypothetical protein